MYEVIALKLISWGLENSFWANFVFLYRLTVVIGSKVEVGALNCVFRKTLFMHKSVILMALKHKNNQILILNSRLGFVFCFD